MSALTDLLQPNGAPLLHPAGTLFGVDGSFKRDACKKAHHGSFIWQAAGSTHGGRRGVFNSINRDRPKPALVLHGLLEKWRP